MRLLFTILGVISALIGLVMSILPFGSLALIPIVAGFIFGVLAFKFAKKENKGTSIIKITFLIIIAGLALTVYRAIFDENIVEDDIETIEKEKASEEEAIKELESIDIDE